MNSRQHQQFLEQLLNQMPELNSEQYRAYRKELDEKLERARHEEKSMRWIVAGAWGGAVALWVVVAILGHSPQNAHSQLPEWLVMLLAEIVLLVPLAALLLLGLYLFKYRRKVNRTQAKARHAALGELQRQLNELRARMLPLDEKQPPSTPQK